MDRIKTENILMPIKSFSTVKTVEGKAYAALAATNENKKLIESVVGDHDPDLGILEAILVTSNTNKNDDVFLREELWAARATPCHKLVNWKHDSKKIIGHMFESVPVDDAGATIAGDDVPDSKFHLSTKSFIYKAALSADSEDLSDGVSEGKYFVSMECWFTDYDYLVGDKVVARNERTSFLDECLRTRGGSGLFDGIKVGRVLRNIIFGGMGVVPNPANDDSVINSYAGDNKPIEATAELNDIIASNVKQVLNEDEKSGDTQICNEPAFADIKTEVKPTMTDLEKLQAKYDSLMKELDTNKAELDEVKNSEAQKEVDGMKADNDGLNQRVAELTDALSAKEKEFVAKNEELEKMDEVKAELVEAQTALSDIRKSEALATRLAALSEKYEVTDELKEKYSESISTMDDEAFTKFEEMIADFAPKKADKPAKDIQADDTQVDDDNDDEEGEVSAMDKLLASISKPSEADLVSEMPEEDINELAVSAVAELAGRASKEEGE